MDLRLAFVGFGNVARAFTRILDERRSQLADQYGITWKSDRNRNRPSRLHNICRRH